MAAGHDETTRFPLGLPSRLRPVEVLGRGGSSVVWWARDTASGRDVAVKVIAATHGSTVDPARRVETEARALARLGPDPGVVRLYEVGRTDDGDAYLVEQLVVGPTLAERSPLPVAHVAAIGRTVAATLARAHAAGVSHGDVTPANVVLAADGSPLLADFGMAGLGHAPDDPGGLTPAFAAPERLRGGRSSAASDIFSLAASLRAVLLVDDSERCAELLGVLGSAQAPVPGERPTAGAMSDALGALARR